MKLSLLLWLTSVLPQHVADQACLATTVYLEARSQSVIGQSAVAEVALRRRDDGGWGKTLCKVVTAPHQFAPATMPRNFNVDNLPAFNKAWRVAGRSIANWNRPPGQRVVLVPHADHFAGSKAKPLWRQHSRLVSVIGAHRFYALN